MSICVDTNVLVKIHKQARTLTASNLQIFSSRPLLQPLLFPRHFKSFTSKCVCVCVCGPPRWETVPFVWCDKTDKLLSHMTMTEQNPVVCGNRLLSQKQDIPHGLLLFDPYIMQCKLGQINPKQEVFCCYLFACPCCYSKAGRRQVNHTFRGVAGCTQAE